MHNKKINYEEYVNCLHRLPLKILREDQVKSFRKSKGKGQFIIQCETEKGLMEERWEFIRFDEGINFKNFKKDSIIYCIPTYVDREYNFSMLPKYSHVNVIYKEIKDAVIDLIFEEDERKNNPFKVKSYNTIHNLDLKVGLYLQTHSFKNLTAFEDKMKEIQNKDFDILVFPETCFTPFTVNFKDKNIFNSKSQKEFIDYCLDLSKEINKSVVVSSIDANNVLFSIYANANASDDETCSRIYIKHTMTNNSPFVDEKYMNYIDQLFTPIKIKEYTIGLTICYDCNHAPFSRMYGLQDVDLIINSSGGDVIYTKWYRYNKARAIENKCFNLVSMGGWKEDKNKNFTYGFNPNGGLILPINLENKEKPSECGKIYIYDLSNCSLESTPDLSKNQKPTISKNIHFEIPVGKSEEILSKSKKIKDNLYIYQVREFNIIFCLVEGKDILKPEKVLPLLYDSSLNKFNYRKYIIINKHDRIDEEFFYNYLSIILKVRCMENFCALILESYNINKCYQVGATRSLQVVQEENNKYGIDLDRTGGPDAIWDNKKGMQKNWRTNFENLIKFMVEKTS